jgi:aminobenzoyl-glutamate utilization protein B
VGGLPTAFTAEFGSGKPIIGIMGEYDALPGISNKAIPEKTPLLAGAPGHGCGHNLFGVASLGAASAIKDLIAAGKLKGTVRFYGTPAEESVGGKVYMAREGLFKDIDVMLAWHPAFNTEADVRSTQAIIDFIVEFKGKTAHAAGDPVERPKRGRRRRGIRARGEPAARAREAVSTHALRDPGSRQGPQRGARLRQGLDVGARFED